MNVGQETAAGMALFLLGAALFSAPIVAPSLFSLTANSSGGGCLAGVFFNVVQVVPTSAGSSLSVTGSACTGSASLVGGQTVYLAVSGAGTASAKTTDSAGGYFSATIALPAGISGSFLLTGSLCPIGQSCAYPEGTATFDIAQVVSSVTTEAVVTGTQTLSCSGTVTVDGQTEPCTDVNPVIVASPGGCVQIGTDGQTSTMSCSTGTHKVLGFPMALFFEILGIGFMAGGSVALGEAYVERRGGAAVG